MLLGMYTLLDLKAGAYLRPFFLRSDAEAIRAMLEGAKDKTQMLGQYPQDFVLYRVGTFDEATARVEPCAPFALGNPIVAMMTETLREVKDA